MATNGPGPLVFSRLALVVGAAAKAERIDEARAQSYDAIRLVQVILTFDKFCVFTSQSVSTILGLTANEASIWPVVGVGSHALQKAIFRSGLSGFNRMKAVGIGAKYVAGPAMPRVTIGVLGWPNGEGGGAAGGGAT
jgi:hypothetical protein